MKTPEEKNQYWSIRYLEALAKGNVKLSSQALNDCAEYLKAAYASVDLLETRLAQVERERDAAADYIHKVYTTLSKPAKKVTSARDHAVWSLYAMNDYFRNWRGVCEENTKEETDG